MSIDGYLSTFALLAAVRYIVTPVWEYAAAAPDSFRLVFQEPDHLPS